MIPHRPLYTLKFRCCTCILLLSYQLHQNFFSKCFPCCSMHQGLLLPAVSPGNIPRLSIMENAAQLPQYLAGGLQPGLASMAVPDYGATHYETMVSLLPAYSVCTSAQQTRYTTEPKYPPVSRHPLCPIALCHLPQSCWLMGVPVWTPIIYPKSAARLMQSRSYSSRSQHVYSVKSSNNEKGFSGLQGVWRTEQPVTLPCHGLSIPTRPGSAKGLDKASANCSLQSSRSKAECEHALPRCQGRGANH